MCQIILNYESSNNIKFKYLNLLLKLIYIAHILAISRLIEYLKNYKII